MPDIDFLSGGSSNKKKGKDGKEAVSWTKPNKDKSSSEKQVEDIFDNPEKPKEGAGKFKTSGLFSFMKKGSGKKSSADGKDEKEASLLTDKESIKNSKKEMMKIIEEKETEKDSAKKKTSKKSRKEKKKEKIDKKEVVKRGSSDGAFSFLSSFFGDRYKGDKSKSYKSTHEDRVDKKNDSQDWSSADVIETNLIKGEVTSYYDWKKGLMLLTVSLVFVGFVIFGSRQGLEIWGENKKNEAVELASKVEDLNVQIRPLEEEAKNIAIVQKKIRLMAELLRDHIYWTNFFKFLEDNTIPDVYYDSFTGDNGGQYSLSATGRSFKTVPQQIIAMSKNNLASDVTVGGVSFASENSEVSEEDDESEDEEEDEEEDSELIRAKGVSFQLNFSVNTDIFKK